MYYIRFFSFWNQASRNKYFIFICLQNDPVIPAFPDLHLSPAAILKELSMYFPKFSAQTRLLSLPAPHELPPREVHEYPPCHLFYNFIGFYRYIYTDSYVKKYLFLQFPWHDSLISDIIWSLITLEPFVLSMMTSLSVLLLLWTRSLFLVYIFYFLYLYVNVLGAVFFFFSSPLSPL